MENEESQENNRRHKSGKETIPVNYKKLSDAPSTSVSPMVDPKLQPELLYGKPAAFIISGYRGAGKTSLIHHLENIIRDRNNTKPKSAEELLFVKCNFVREETKAHLLRKLTRGLLVTAQESKAIQKKLKWPWKRKLKLELELLYKRTFHDINEILKNTREVSRSSTFRLDVLLSLVIIVILAFSYFNIDTAGFLAKVKDFLSKNGAFWGKTISIPLILSYIYVRQKVKKDLNDIEYKTLYDEEIAEVKLLESIDKLNKLNTKIIFVIDELDKVEMDAQLEKLISDLKPIIFYGNATFLLVTGQKLYYELEKSKYIDDAILPNLFTKTVHVPLLQKEHFQALLKEFVDSPKQEKKEVLDHYLDSMILKSNRSPRKLISLIRNDLTWKGEKAFIVIDEEQKRMNQFHAKILASMESFIRIQEIKKYNPAEQDFLITQLYLSMNKILGLGASYFKLEDIRLNAGEDQKQKYPDGYWERAEKLIELLINHLVDDTILEYKNDTEQYTLNEDYSQWSQADLDIAIGQFISNYQYFELFIRGLYFEVYGVVENKSLNLQKMIMDLVKEKAILNDESLMKIIHLRNKVVHSTQEVKQQINKIKDAQVKMNVIQAKLISEFTYYVVTELLEPQGYQVAHGLESDSEYDLLAVTDDTEKSNFVFQIKVINSVENTLKSDFIRMRFGLDQLTKEMNKKVKFVTIYYCNDSDQQLELDLYVQHELNEYIKDEFVVIYPYLNRLKENKSIRKYLEEAL